MSLDNSPEGTRLALLRLVEQGVILTQPAGSARLYRLNPDHLAFQHIVGLASIGNTLIDRLRHAITDAPIPPIYAAMFGSAARQEMTPTSDIDLFFVRPDEADDEVWKEWLHKLALHISSWTGNDVRPLVLAESEVRAGIAQAAPILESIAAEEVCLAGHRDWLRKLQRELRSKH